MQCVLSTFDLAEMLRTGRGIRASSYGAATFEEAAQRMCRTLYTGLCAPDGSPACVLVRCYKTHPYGELPPELQQFARSSGSGGLRPTTRCLVLLGTAGIEPEWNSRRNSLQHQAIPLSSAEVIEQAPMIARLFNDLGVGVSHLLSTDTVSPADVRPKTYGVFHIETARGSPAIPAQEDFVLRYGVESVIGCGGDLPRGEMFATILFSRVEVSPAVAERFRSLSLDMKASLFGFDANQTFASHPPAN